MKYVKIGCLVYVYTLAHTHTHTCCTRSSICFRFFFSQVAPTEFIIQCSNKIHFRAAFYYIYSLCISAAGGVFWYIFLYRFRCFVSLLSGSLYLIFIFNIYALQCTRSYFVCVFVWNIFRGKNCFLFYFTREKRPTNDNQPILCWLYLVTGVPCPRKHRIAFFCAHFCKSTR